MKADSTVASYVNVPHIHIIGANQCVIDGLKGIAEYSGDVIEINLGSYSVRITGDGLHIDSFTHQGAVIEGTILFLELVG